MHRQEAIEGIHICLGAGNDDIHIRTASHICPVIFLHTDRDVSEGVNPLSDGVNAVLGQSIRDLDYSVNGLVDSINTPTWGG